MPEQRCFAFFRCANSSEISIELQQRQVQEYCRTMGYILFSEITSDQPCTEEQARQIATIYRKEMGENYPLKMIVLNLHRLGNDIHLVRQVASIFKEYDIEVESTCAYDNSLLALTEQDEYEFYQALMGTSLRNT